jgi:hypothetical protein
MRKGCNPLPLIGAPFCGRLRLGSEITFGYAQAMEEVQLTIRSADGGPLADTEEVRTALDGLFPGTAWEWTSSGAERLASAEVAGLELPQAVRWVMESQPPMLCGKVETAGAVMTFNLGPGGQVPAIWITLSGDGPAVETTLARLRSRRGWSLGPGEGWFITNAE